MGNPWESDSGQRASEQKIACIAMERVKTVKEIAASIAGELPEVHRSLHHQCHRESAQAAMQDREEAGAFPQRRGSHQAAVLGLAQHVKDRKMPPRTWKGAANQFAIMFGERFTDVLN